MIRIKPITDEQVKRAIESREFEKAMLSESPDVAVIMTQDWCSQWTSMEEWLSRNPDPEAAINGDCTIYTLIYNKKPYFHDFMSFKETVWNNTRIPYVRYYKNGALIASSNFVSKEQFYRYFQD